jgi:hypothetical protein
MLNLLVSSTLVFLIALLVLMILRFRNQQEVRQIWQNLAAQPTGAIFTPDFIADLPEPVQRYFLHAIAPGTPLATSVKLTMQGSIRLGADQAWLPLQAEEMLSKKGFVWKATAGQGVMSMRGADYFSNGQGRMRFALWGLIPVVNVSNPDVHRSALGRWAGECFWLPSVLLPQQGVTWTALDEHTLQALVKFTDPPVTLTFVIDPQGRLLRAAFLRWGNQTANKHYTEILFGCENQDEQTFAGYTIPSQVGAGWRLGAEDAFEFIRMTIQQAEFS